MKHEYKLQPLTAKQLMQMQFKPREWLIDGLLKRRQLALVYAASGLGKSWFSWSLACLAAGTGSGLKDYSNGDPRKALVIDGEMDLEDAQERLTVLCEALGCDKELLGENLTIVSRQYQDPKAPFVDLDDPEWQGRTLDYCMKQGIEFVVLDNLSTLLKVDDENSAAAMDGLTDFLLKLKAAGVGALLVHHANKADSSFRGSQKISVTFDLILKLSKPTVTIAGEGASFDVSFEKNRGMLDNLPFKLTLTPTGWLHEEGDKHVELALAALRTGQYKSYDDLAKGLGLKSKSSAHERIMKAVMTGLATKDDIGRYFDRAKITAADVALLDDQGGMEDLPF